MLLRDLLVISLRNIVILHMITRLQLKYKSKYRPGVISQRFVRVREAESVLEAETTEMCSFSKVTLRQLQIKI